MSNFGTSTGTTQPFIPVVPRGQIGRYAGLAMHFATLADLNSAVGDERSNIAASSAIWADGQPLQAGNEPGIRKWNASAQHARNFFFGGGKQVLLAADSNAALLTSGAPTGGNDGDLAVDPGGNAYYVKASGAWGSAVPIFGTASSGVISLTSGVQQSVGSMTRLDVTGTGSLSINSIDAQGVVSTAAFAKSYTGASHVIEFPYYGSAAVAIVATFTGLTVKVLQ